MKTIFINTVNETLPVSLGFLFSDLELCILADHNANLRHKIGIVTKILLFGFSLLPLLSSQPAACLACCLTEDRWKEGRKVCFFSPPLSQICCYVHESVIPSTGNNFSGVPDRSEGISKSHSQPLLCQDCIVWLLQARKATFPFTVPLFLNQVTERYVGSVKSKWG